MNNPAANSDQAGFTGHIKDSATGLNYMQARYYDPLIGRFLSIDPVGFSPAQPFMFNRYAYVGNDPVNAVDPFGLDNCEVTPKGTKDCIGDEDADPESEEDAEDREEIDEIVITAKRKKRDWLSRPRETAFRVNLDGVKEVDITRTETIQCPDGRTVERNVLDRSAFNGAAAGGHTHPKGYDDAPGPEDGNLAAATGKPAYIITNSGVVAIEEVGGSFRARLIQGKWGTSRSAVQRRVNQYNSSGGTGRAPVCSR